MERRFTAFLLPLVLALAVMTFMMPGNKTQPGPQGQAPASRPATQGADSQRAPARTRPDEEYRFTKGFGTTGTKGAMWVAFDRRGAAIRRVWLRDHFHAIDGKLKSSEERSGDDDYRIVDVSEPGMFGFVLEPEFGRHNAFRDVPIDGTANPRTGEEQVWEVEDLPDGVRFKLDAGNGYTLTKTYRHEPGRRGLRFALGVAATGPLQSRDSLYLSLRGVTLPTAKSERMFGAAPASAFGLAAEGGRPVGSGTILHADAKPELRPLVDNQGGRAAIAFAGSMNRFFASFVIPRNAAAQRALYKVDIQCVPRFADLASETDPYSLPLPHYRLQLDALEPGKSSELEFEVYLGPKSYEVFAEQPEWEHFHYALDADLAPFGCICNPPGSAFMAKVLLKSLAFLHSLLGNWPLAIIALTLLVRSLLVPLNFRMQKSMRAFGQKVARLKPQMEALKKRYADDPKQQQQELVKFQREHKMFPPLGGCLPLLITMPVFIGMFTAVRACYELRHTGFVFWIHDLSQPDALFHLGWSWVPDFNVLPFVMMAMWWLMQSGTPLPTDPQQRQMAVMMKWMPIVMGITLYGYASGLMLYMITSSTFQLVENKIVKKILGPMDPNAGIAPTPSF